MCHGRDLDTANARAKLHYGAVFYEVLDGKSVFDEDVRIVFWSMPGDPPDKLISTDFDLVIP